MRDAPRPRDSFWSRGTLALALVLYGWLMLAVELLLKGAELPAGPDRGLALFRRLIMGRAVVGVGGAAVLAAIIVAGLALSGLRHRAAAVAALVLGTGWLACLAATWPI